jgi:hypothetical protein
MIAKTREVQHNPHETRSLDLCKLIPISPQFYTKDGLFRNFSTLPSESLNNEATPSVKNLAAPDALLSGPLPFAQRRVAMLLEHIGRQGRP